MYTDYCLWNLQTVQCQDKTSLLINHRKRRINHSDQCPRMYLQQSINRLPLNTNQTMVIHFDQCDQLKNVESCQLNDYRKRLSFLSTNAIAIKGSNMTDLCSLKCSFSLINNNSSIAFQRPLYLNLSLHFTNQTSISLPRTHISLYHCERMASNCTSCQQLDPSFGCIWCNNMCMLKHHVVDEQFQCPHHRECLTPVIQLIEPTLLPMNGGTIVTIKGKNFDLFNLIVTLADVPCRLIEDDSSNDQ